MDEIGSYLAIAAVPLAFGVATWLAFRRGNPGIVAGNALVLGLMVSLVFLGFETYYRFFYDATDAFALTKVTERWFQRHYHLNNWNYRDDVDYVVEIAPGKRRITFLGDSFTMGHGVPDVSQRFANRLRAEHPDWEVHAIAMNGWDTDDELAVLARGRPYAFDEVVLVYVPNDISDDAPQMEDEVRAIYARFAKLGPLLEHSYFANLLYFRWMARRVPYALHYYDLLRAAYDGDAWKRHAQRLVQLRDLVRARGGHLSVVTFPFLQTLGPDDPFRAVREKLARFWADEGVPELDLAAAFEGIPTEDLVVGPQDPHPNARAHALAAEAMGPFLEEQLARRAPAAGLSGR